MRGGALARVGAGGDEVAGRARPGGFEVVGPGGAGMGWGGGPDGARRRAGQTGPRGGQIGRGGGGLVGTVCTARKGIRVCRVKNAQEMAIAHLNSVFDTLVDISDSCSDSPFHS